MNVDPVCDTLRYDLPGLGGTFVLLEGKVKHHVMPDFSARALCSDDDVDAWLHYFEMRAPITHVGTLVTGDMVSAPLVIQMGRDVVCVLLIPLKWTSTVRV